MKFYFPRYCAGKSISTCVLLMLSLDSVWFEYLKYSLSYQVWSFLPNVQINESLPHETQVEVNIDMVWFWTQIQTLMELINENSSKLIERSHGKISCRNWLNHPKSQKKISEQVIIFRLFLNFCLKIPDFNYGMSSVPLSDLFSFCFYSSTQHILLSQTSSAIPRWSGGRRKSWRSTTIPTPREASDLMACGL